MGRSEFLTNQTKFTTNQTEFTLLAKSQIWSFWTSDIKTKFEQNAYNT